MQVSPVAHSVLPTPVAIDSSPAKPPVDVLLPARPVARPPTPHAAPWNTEGQSFIFASGQKTLMLVRYSASEIPVYDELLLAEPREVNGVRGSVVTHMYVSNQISVNHGRGIWQLPKKLAEFTWDTDAQGQVSVAVNLPGAAAPFFRATISKPAQWLALPARLMPTPPLLQDDLYDGTSAVYRTDTQMRGKARPAHLLHFETDGIEMPAKEQIPVLTWGANLEPMKFRIEAPQVMQPSAS